MSKFFLRSLTIQGAFVLFASWALARFGVEVSESELTTIVENILALAGFGMVIVGRWRASHSLHVKK